MRHQQNICSFTDTVTRAGIVFNITDNVPRVVSGKVRVYLNAVKLLLCHQTMASSKLSPHVSIFEALQ